MCKTIGKVAPLTQVASAGKMEPEELTTEIAREIREETNETVIIRKDISPENSKPLSDFSRKSWYNRQGGNLA